MAGLHSLKTTPTVIRNALVCATYGPRLEPGRSFWMFGISFYSNEGPLTLQDTTLIILPLLELGPVYLTKSSSPPNLSLILCKCLIYTAHWSDSFYFLTSIDDTLTFGIRLLSGSTHLQLLIQISKICYFERHHFRRRGPVETKLVAYYSKNNRLLFEIAMLSSTGRALMFKKCCMYNRKMGINVEYQPSILNINI